MPKERRPTEHIMEMVRRSRVRLVLAIQAALMVIALIFVWGWLGNDAPLLAWIISGVLVVVELVLLVAYLMQPVQTLEEGTKPVADNANELVLEDPAGGTITLDRVRHEIIARNASVRVPVAEIRSVMVEAGRDSRLMLTLARDLVLLSEMGPCTPREIQLYRSVGLLLARASEVPFEES